MTYPAPPPNEEPPQVPPPVYPELRTSEQIQGNVLAGFRKDRQQLLFVSFAGDQVAGRRWLTKLLPRIATTAQVAAFNEKFSAARSVAGGDPSSLAAVWVNLSLTASGIRILSSTDPFPSDTSDAFVTGAHAAAGRVGDQGTDDPTNWLFGRGDQTIDAVVTIQADRETDFQVELERQHQLLAAEGLSILFEQDGSTLPGDAAGHEHFGFKDGISQPGVGGFDEPDPNEPDQVKDQPGRDLINPGAFVLGYPDQSGTVPPAPGWMRDGSFHVVRRLAQDVPAWWAQVEEQRKQLDPNDPLSADALAAKLVGRWRSGTPLAHAPDQDLRSGHLSDDDNDFEFADDPEGHMTPRFAHIRKVYPRDEQPPGEEEAERRRIIRRGIPFGLPFDPALGRGHGVDAERGLVFAAFMASIENQFEFLQSTWANNVNFPKSGDGADPVIGTASPVTLKREGQADATMTLERFVRTEGGLYAFAPSLATLAALAQGAALAG
jgi:Dyp-type peroxidase family